MFRVIHSGARIRGIYPAAVLIVVAAFGQLVLANRVFFWPINEAIQLPTQPLAHGLWALPVLAVIRRGSGGLESRSFRWRGFSASIVLIILAVCLIVSWWVDWLTLTDGSGWSTRNVAVFAASLTVAWYFGGEGVAVLTLVVIQCAIVTFGKTPDNVPADWCFLIQPSSALIDVIALASCCVILWLCFDGRESAGAD